MHPLWKPIREDRTFEWTTAGAIAATGLLLILPFPTIREWAAPWWFSETWLGIAVFLSGAANLGTLIVNGRDDRTPRWRSHSLKLALISLGALLLVALAEGQSCLDAGLPAVLLVMVAIGIRRAAVDDTHIKARRNAGLPSAHH